MSQDFITNNGMITAAFAQQFHDSFEIQTQQKDSRLVQSVYSRCDASYRAGRASEKKVVTISFGG